MLACGLHCTLVPLHVVHLKLRMPASEKFMKQLTVLTLLFLLTALPVFGRGSHSHGSYRSHRSTGTAACCSREKRRARPRLYEEERNRCSSIPSHASKRQAAGQLFDEGQCQPVPGKVGTKKATH
jgi:hypothetical protein